MFRELVRGYFSPIINDYIHKLTTSNMRATIISIQSMFMRLGYALISFSIGFFGDMFSLRLSMFFGGIILTMTLVFFIFAFRNGKNSHVYN